MGFLKPANATTTSTDSDTSTSTTTSTLEINEDALQKVKFQLKFENLINIRTKIVVRIRVIQNKAKTE